VTRHRTGSSWLLAVVAIFMVGAVAACGGSSGSSSGKSTTTTSTRAGSGVGTKAYDQAAKAAAVALADLGTGWTQYRKPGGFLKASTEKCTTQLGSPLKGSDPLYSGPMFQDQTKKAFAYTYTYVFPTEAAAQAFTAMRRTQEFVSCKGTTDDAAQKKADAKTFVRVKPGDPQGVGAGGFEGYYAEEAGGKNANGTEYINANYFRYTYRFGRVVSVVLFDAAIPDNAAAATALNTELATAQTSTTAAIKSRVDALNL
jgi:hypothetical protein